jgi:hypothetical protein
MKLTRIQQIGIVFFMCSLLPAYLITNWRYEAKLTSLNQMLQKEQALHLSTDKLLINCEKIAAHKEDRYDAMRQICSQGSDIHKHTEHAMTLLNEEKAMNEMKWYRNLGLAVVFFNLFAFTLFRASIYLKRETD